MEPRTDMFPEESQTISDITEDVKIEEQEPEDVVVPQLAKEVKTPSNELLAALQEERGKRKAAEAKIQELESSPSHFDTPMVSFSEEGSVSSQEFQSLRQEIKTLRDERETERVFTQFPQLKEKAAEFSSYRSEYSGVPADKVAKLFLAEQGMLEQTPVRKGLERPSGGSKKIEPDGISAKDIQDMMKNDFRKFERMMKKGQIDPDKIR